MIPQGPGLPHTPAELLVVLKNSRPFLPVLLLREDGTILYQHPSDAAILGGSWRKIPLAGGQIWVRNERDAEEVEVIGPFESLIADVQDLVVVVGASGQILQVNAKTKEVLGPVRDLAELPSGAVLALLSEEPMMQPHVGRDGRRRTFLWRGHTLPQTIPVRALQAMNIDFDPREEHLLQLQEQLLVAAQMSSLGALAAVVVHELNQPLHVLSGYVELLRGGHFSGDAQDRAFGVMERAIKRIQTLVQSLRTETVEPRRERVNLKVVAELARDLTVGGAMVGIEAENVWVLGDPGRLEQAVINLLANALQAGSQETVVRVYRRGGEGVLEVADRGHGVPEELKTKVFEPFFTTKGQDAGMGLGLSVSVGIIQSHAGKLELMDNIGGGSVFRIVIPLVDGL